MEKEKLTFDEFINEPAFPSFVAQLDIELARNGNVVPLRPGLTRLEYFTGLAMQGFCADKTSNNSAENVSNFSHAVAIKTLKDLYSYYLASVGT